MLKATTVTAIILTFILIQPNLNIPAEAKIQDTTTLQKVETPKDQTKETYGGAFFEGFEKGVKGWISEPSWFGRTVRFEAVSKPSPVYDGKYSLMIVGKGSKPRQASQIRWIYDLSDKGVKVEPNLKCTFAWRFPEKTFSYIGLFLIFSDGRVGYYISSFHGMYSNSTKSYIYMYFEPENTWLMHERDIYHDYGGVFGSVGDVALVSVGLILSDTYATGTQQTVYYDTISIAPDAKTPPSFAAYLDPASQRINPGGVVVFTILVKPIGAYKGEVTVNLSGVPPGFTASLSQTFGNPPFISGLRVSVRSSVNPGTYRILVAVSDRETSRLMNATLNVEMKVRFILEAKPSVQIVGLGGSTTYSLSLRLTEPYGAVHVRLSVSGLPRNTTYTISPESVTLTNTTLLNSTLTVGATIFASTGNYPIQLTATDTDQGLNSTVKVVLVISGASFTVEAAAEKPTYKQGEKVTLYGAVRYLENLPVQGGSVSIQVLSPSGTTVHVASTVTDMSGQYYDNFTLPKQAEVGTYNIYVTVSLPGYQESQGQATFTVGESQTPSITISSIYLTDTAGYNRSSFSSGETVIVRVVVHNGGAELKNGIIWVEVDDPEGVPVSVTFVELTISRGGRVTLGVSTTLSGGTVTGYYFANSYVSDRMIAQGGKFLASAKTVFQVY
ncbi:MAG: MG2 domain-containing protein [Candidatus Bathyarchaeia archaeon]